MLYDALMIVEILWPFLMDEGWIVEGAFCLLWRYPAMAERREKPRG